MRRALSLVLAAAVIVVAILLVWHKRSAEPSPPTAPSSSTSTAVAGATPSSPEPTAKHVTRITPERRAQVASRIQAAKAARERPALPPTSRTAPPRPSTAGADMTTPQQILDQFLKLNDEIHGYLEECAKIAPDVHEANTSILLTGDPDVGTLIDAPDPAVGSDGKPVPAAFDECIRGALQTLELPPMQTGTAFKVTFQMTM